VDFDRSPRAAGAQLTDEPVLHRGWHNSHASSAHPTKRIAALRPGISRKRSTSAGDEFGERLLRLGASDDMRRVMPLFAPLLFEVLPPDPALTRALLVPGGTWRSPRCRTRPKLLSPALPMTTPPEADLPLSREAVGAALGRR
jgi:hypothetical protein